MKSTDGLAIDAIAPGFLIATPALSDPNFSHAVILMCVHNEDGAMGLVLNRPSPVTLGDIMNQVGVETERSYDETALIGGPVAIENGVLLFQSNVKLSSFNNELLITPGLKLCSDQEILQAIAAGSGPDRYRMFLGHAGWAPGQLEREVAEGAWMPIALDLELVFDEHADDLWERALASAGLHPGMLTNFRPN